MEIDKMVQLIESPIFACKALSVNPAMSFLLYSNAFFIFPSLPPVALRLALISHSNDNADAQHLSRALYGILMLLPQTEAFHLLNNRLKCVPNYWSQPNKM